MSLNISNETIPVSVSRIENLVTSWLKENNPIVRIGDIDQPLLHNDAEGKPVLHQRSDKHEFDLLTHSRKVAEAVVNFDSEILPLIPDIDVSDFVPGLRNCLEPAAIAAYLHDIDKLFKERAAYHPLHPMDKPEGQKFPVPDGTANITNLLNQFDPKLVEQAGIISYIYKIVDAAIISAGSGGEIDSGKVLETIKQIDTIPGEVSLKIWGLMLMIADNIGQGNPPGRDASFDWDMARNQGFISDLLNLLLNSDYGN